jgi:hypothetical protein
MEWYGMQISQFGGYSAFVKKTKFSQNPSQNPSQGQRRTSKDYLLRPSTVYSNGSADTAKLKKGDVVQWMVAEKSVDQRSIETLQAKNPGPFKVDKVKAVQDWFSLKFKDESPMRLVDLADLKTGKVVLKKIPARLLDKKG